MSYRTIDFLQALTTAVKLQKTFTGLIGSHLMVLTWTKVTCSNHDNLTSHCIMVLTNTKKLKQMLKLKLRSCISFLIASKSIFTSVERFKHFPKAFHRAT